MRLASATRSWSRLAFGDRGERCPIAAKQSARDPVGSEQANDAADDARKRDAQHQRDAGVGIGREIGRVRLGQRQLHRDIDGKHEADPCGRGPRRHPAEQQECRRECGNQHLKGRDPWQYSKQVDSMDGDDDEE